MSPDKRTLPVSNRQIDLYQLHTEAPHPGVANVSRRFSSSQAMLSSLQVKRRNLWHVIASKLNLHSNGQRTADQIAEQLHNAYAQFLEAFEMQYTTAMMKQSMGGGVSDQSAAEDAAWELAELASMLPSSL